MSRKAAPKPPCAEEGCDRPAEKRGLCGTCYARLKGSGALPPIPCVVPECTNEHYRKGPCLPHREEFKAAGMKWCLKPLCANPLKPWHEFPKLRKTSDGLSSWCKECHGGYSNTRYHSGDNAAKQADYYAQLRLVNPGHHHGISGERYWKMLADQGEKCAICLRRLRRDRHDGLKPHVDHDHAHGCGNNGCATCVRSLLCKACNSMLARAHDDPAILCRWKPTKAYPQTRIDAATMYLNHWHAEMVKRGVRPSPEEAMWDDLFAAATRLVLEIAPN